MVPNSVFDKFNASVSRKDESPNYKQAFEEAYQEAFRDLRGQLTNAQDQLKVTKAALETAQQTINILGRQLTRREDELTRMRKSVNGHEVKQISIDDDSTAELHGE